MPRRALAKLPGAALRSLRSACSRQRTLSTRTTTSCKSVERSSLELPGAPWSSLELPGAPPNFPELPGALR
eukprot:15459246-Alexandrium_andersonii.AAC.1